MVFLALLAQWALLAWRSNVLRLGGGGTPLSKEEEQAHWAFTGAGLAAVATLVGALLTYGHNTRRLRMERIETLTKSLALIGRDDGGYAPAAQVAGALGTLVYLGQDVVGVRTLGSAWEGEALDAGAACWLISTVVAKPETPPEVKTEAVEILRRNAAKVTRTEPGDFEWPRALWERWPVDLEVEARHHVLHAFFGALFSRSRQWWQPNRDGWSRR